MPTGTGAGVVAGDAIPTRYATAAARAMPAACGVEAKPPTKARTTYAHCKVSSLYHTMHAR